MNARTMLVAAVAAAAAVTSACSSTVTGTASTASETGRAPAVGTVAAAPLAAGSHSVNAVVPSADVTGQGSIVKDSGDPSTQFGSVPKPGLVLLSGLTPDGEWDMCTLGPAIRTTDAGRTGFATAGHCGKNDPLQRLQVQSSLSGASATAPLASIADPADGVFDPVSGTATDSAALWTGTVDPAAARIAGTWPVAGVLTFTSAKQLPAHTTQVCFDGAVSEVVCGPLLDTDSSGLLRFAAVSQEGDSGSAVFLVNPDTQAATLVGILKGGNARTTTATYLEPALTRLNATALIDPAAANVVSGDPRYSTRVAPLT